MVMTHKRETAPEKAESLDGLKVLIIGAGFGGLASAIELQHRGAAVTVLEASPDMKKQGKQLFSPNGAVLVHSTP